MEYVIGVDGGGTKTAVKVADLNGKTICCFQTGAINLNGESEENVRSNLKDILKETVNLTGGLETCRTICIGAAGISNPKTETVLKDSMRGAGYTGSLIITGDHETALYGALGVPEGVILIAGTGSICFGKNSAGEKHRSGGFGYLIDDEGSGYAIGRDILTAVVHAYDGRGEKTILTQLVYEQFKVSSVSEIIGYIYRKDFNKRDIAALAPCITQAYLEGDSAAKAIISKCGNELLNLIQPVIEKLELTCCSLAMTGSVLTKNEYVRKSFVDQVSEKYPGIRCKLPDNDAAYGAVLMALENLNI